MVRLHRFGIFAMAWWAERAATRLGTVVSPGNSALRAANAYQALPSRRVGVIARADERVPDRVHVLAAQHVHLLACQLRQLRRHGTRKGLRSTSSQRSEGHQLDPLVLSTPMLT